MSTTTPGTPAGRTPSDATAGAGTTRPEDELLELGPTYAYGVQHILTRYGGVTAPPLFASGPATIPRSVGIPFIDVLRGGVGSSPSVVSGAPPVMVSDQALALRER